MTLLSSLEATQTLCKFHVSLYERFMTLSNFEPLFEHTRRCFYPTAFYMKRVYNKTIEFYRSLCIRSEMVVMARFIEHKPTLYVC